MNYALVVSDGQKNLDTYIGRCLMAAQLLARKEVGAIILASREEFRVAFLYLCMNGVQTNDIITLPLCDTPQEEFDLGYVLIKRLAPGGSLHLITRASPNAPPPGLAQRIARIKRRGRKKHRGHVV